MYKVIIIDDEKAAIETLRRDLEVQADLEIKGTAGNGAKGKKLIMDIHPDLLFLDIELPDILPMINICSRPCANRLLIIY